MILKLNSQEEKHLECAKVFKFFRKVLDIPEVEDVKIDRPEVSPLSPARGEQCGKCKSVSSH